jgi:hypothetical protein
MRVFRYRAGLIAAFMLSWQIAILLTGTAGAGCLKESATPVAGEIANCPMHQPPPDPICRAHPQQSTGRDCGCPKLGRSQSMNGLSVLFGPVGVLPPIADRTPLVLVERAVIVPTPSGSHNVAEPVAPPPRV